MDSNRQKSFSSSGSRFVVYDCVNPVCNLLFKNDKSQKSRIFIKSNPPSNFICVDEDVLLVKNSDYRQVEDPVHSKGNEERTTASPLKILLGFQQKASQNKVKKGWKRISGWKLYTTT
jgi:hypothetical protein